MRIISAGELIPVTARLCIQANRRLPQDVKDAICRCAAAEPWPQAKNILEILEKNYTLAERNEMPICQDTGMACVFLSIGRDVHVEGDLEAAVNEGVRVGYREGYLRKSIVGDPIFRGNTGDNTPAMIYYDFVPGDRITVTVAPKGFGSENMSKIQMLKPSDGLEGVLDFVVRTVETAGPNPCPPIVVGVGVGGSFDKAALLAKKALLRPIGSHNENPRYREIEETLLKRINELGIGPQGFGGRTTALGVQVEYLPTHIAGMPVAVNISCHVTRHATEVL